MKNVLADGRLTQRGGGGSTHRPHRPGVGNGGWSEGAPGQYQSSPPPPSLHSYTIWSNLCTFHILLVGFPSFYNFFFFILFCFVCKFFVFSFNFSFILSFCLNVSVCVCSLPLILSFYYCSVEKLQLFLSFFLFFFPPCFRSDPDSLANSVWLIFCILFHFVLCVSGQTSARVFFITRNKGLSATVTNKKHSIFKIGNFTRITRIWLMNELINNRGLRLYEKCSRLRYNKCYFRCSSYYTYITVLKNGTFTPIIFR